MITVIIDVKTVFLYVIIKKGYATAFSKFSPTVHHSTINNMHELNNAHTLKCLFILFCLCVVAIGKQVLGEFLGKFLF